MSKEYFRKLNSEERGIATILTVGILALLAALAIGFVSEAILLEKVSKNSLNLERSRLLAQSMVQRTLAAAEYYNEITSSALINFHSTVDTITDTDTLSTAISTTHNNIVYYEWDENDPDRPRWQYIRTIRNSDGDSQIIGRIAYVTINNIGKLDPSVVVDSGGNPSGAVTEDTDLFTSYGVLGRPGRDVNEIFAAYLNSNVMTHTVLQKISATNADPKGELTERLRWFDISEMIGAAGINNEEEDTDTRTLFNNWFTTDNPTDPEAFWIDCITGVDANGIDHTDIIDSQYEQYHRFNLTRTDWDDFTVDSMLGIDVDPDTVPFDSSLTNNGYSEETVTVIPWLKNWKDAGEMGSIPNCRNQIIANLIDYCDSDTEATTDYPSEDPPTYVGLEKVPYINELHLNLQGTARWQKLTGQDYRYQTIVMLSYAKLETVDLYNTNTSITGKLNLSFQYRFAIDDIISTVNVPEITFTITHTGNDYIVSQPAAFIPQSYYYPVDSVSWKTFTNSGGVSNFGIKDFTYTANISLEDSNGNLLDYATITDTLDPFTTNNLNSDDGSEFKIVYFNSQVPDPRQNLLSSDWSSSSSTTSTETLLDDNSNYTPETGDDPENNGGAGEPAPWEISTAYIRNAPMQSPWELGFIHRGAAWQTINLKAYNSGEGVATDAGGNAYSDGDANILDQIKMSSQTETYGKVNINTEYFNPIPTNFVNKVNASLDIFVSLFKDIFINIGKSNYNNPGTQAGDPVSANNAEQFALTLYSACATSFKTRAELVNAVEILWNGNEVTQTNDASQEEIIGKMINLTTAGTSNNITLIAVAQVIKDVGGGIVIDGEARNFDEYAPGVDPILAEQKILVTLIRNPITFKWQVKKLRYLNL